MRRLLAILGVVMLAGGVGAQEVRWDLDSFARVIQPLERPLEDRLPLFVWNFPLPRGEAVVKMRADGSLRRAIDMMAARGFVPTVETGWDWTPAGIVALGQALQEAGQPVFLQTGMTLPDIYKNAPKVKGKFRDGTTEVPCLMRYDYSEGQAKLASILRGLDEAGVKVDGVWSDYEGFPDTWGPLVDGQSQPGCREDYPPGIVDDATKLVPFLMELRAKIVSEAIVDTVHEVFPEAIVGNYGLVSSSLAHPVYGMNWLTGAWGIGRLNVSMPVAYANNNRLPNYFHGDWPITQVAVDAYYFTRMLGEPSAALANREAGQKVVVYVSRYCPDLNSPKYMYGISPPLYRELLRHLYLRGADGLYCFNGGYDPKGAVSARQSLESLEDARAVTDELLAYREYLDRGTPMNFAVEAHSTVVWSGLRLKDSALVRTFAYRAEGQSARVEAFPGVMVSLPAPPEGGTYLVEADGTYRKVG